MHPSTPRHPALPNADPRFRRHDSRSPEGFQSGNELLRTGQPVRAPVGGRALVRLEVRRDPLLRADLRVEGQQRRKRLHVDGEEWEMAVDHVEEGYVRDGDAGGAVVATLKLGRELLLRAAEPLSWGPCGETAEPGALRGAFTKMAMTEPRVEALGSGGDGSTVSM